MCLASTKQAKINDGDSGYGVEMLWADRTELPHWFIVWRSLVPIQPSSAMIERAFSHSRVAISDNQHFALIGGMTEASLLLKCNRNRPLDSVSK